MESAFIKRLKECLIAYDILTLKEFAIIYRTVAQPEEHLIDTAFDNCFREARDSMYRLILGQKVVPHSRLIELGLVNLDGTVPEQVKHRLEIFAEIVINGLTD